jgi:hypothetical protein
MDHCGGIVDSQRGIKIAWRQLGQGKERGRAAEYQGSLYKQTGKLLMAGITGI